MAFSFLICLLLVLFFWHSWNHFKLGIFLLFFLLPTYLIRFHVGLLPSTFLEGMLLSLVFIWLLKNKQYLKLPTLIKNLFTEHKLLFVGIVLFLLGATISIFTAIDTKKALGEWRAFYVEPVLLFFVLSSYLKSFEAKKRKKIIEQYILLPLVLCGLITSAFAIFQHFTGFLVPHAFWANRETYRVTAWYGFPNAVGLFLAPIIPLAIYLLAQTWQRTKKIFHPTAIISMLFVITGLLAILFAKGSGPLLGAMAGVGVLLLFYKKTRVPTILFGIVGLIGIVFLPADHTLKQELLAKNYSGELRRDIWQETAELLKDRPLVGAGIASYEERILPYRQNLRIEVFHHPHNIFLTIWVNTGLIGLIGFLVVVLWFVIAAIKNSNQETIFLLGSLIVILVMGLVDSPYIKNDLSVLFWLFPTLLLSIIPSKK